MLYRDHGALQVELPYRHPPCRDQMHPQSRRTHILEVLLDLLGLCFYVNFAAHGKKLVLGQHIYQARWLEKFEGRA